MAMRRFIAALALVPFLAFGLGGAAAAAQPLRIGTDISHPPLEFYRHAGGRVHGFDADIAREIAKRLGRPATFVNMPFGDLLHAVASGKVDFTISSMFDLPAREKVADFVDYFLSGTAIMVRAGNPHNVFTLAGFCGLTASAEVGTFQFTALKEQSARCRALGLGGVHVVSVAGDEQGARALLAGRVAIHIADFPIVSYLARTVGGGKLVVAGRPFNQIPYGIAVRKGNLALRTAIVGALRAMVADGTYDRLLKKWHLQAGALRSIPVDAGQLYQH